MYPRLSRFVQAPTASKATDSKTNVDDGNIIMYCTFFKCESRAQGMQYAVEKEKLRVS
jgi:predicted GNAT family acetyltransferase